MSHLDDNVWHTIPHVGGCSWVALFHAHRKLHVRLLGSVAFAVGALSQRLGDHEEGNVHPVLEKLRDHLQSKRGRSYLLQLVTLTNVTLCGTCKLNLTTPALLFGKPFEDGTHATKLDTRDN